jgi:hypothetical protein
MDLLRELTGCKDPHVSVQLTFMLELMIRRRRIALLVCGSILRGCGKPHLDHDKMYIIDDFTDMPLLKDVMAQILEEWLRRRPGEDTYASDTHMYALKANFLPSKTLCVVLDY